ncbi:unnamed protein product [Parascedosporium putredinis]|uniref:Carrier domain-containing protein n=1 Tax=Parascedosporium putredinis TaxID=1442378 RepID=A0A9P1HCN0_9PEZI|nr:unnamed protein product [Parascedosporium putredinis]CAI8004896.1 unnamed protein product [Parascedosporium putredinis]
MLDDLPMVITNLDVDACELTPTVAGSLLRSRQNAPGLKLLLTIGEMLSEPVIKEFGGSPEVETMLWAITLVPGMSSNSSPNIIGIPLDTVSCYVISGDYKPEDPSSFVVLPRGSIGELVVGGYQNAEGYLNRAEQTASVFVDSPVGPVYRTGDLARIREDGALECLGRMSEGQVKLRGQRIELGEVEHAALRVPGCHSAVAAVVNNILVLFCAVDAHEDMGIIDTAIAQMCAEWLPAFMVPGDIIAMQSFPRLASGKVDRKQLKADYQKLLSERDSGGNIENEVSPLAMRLITTISAMTGTKVGLGTALVSAGIDSLGAIKLSSLLRRDGLNVSSIQILKARTSSMLVETSHNPVAYCNAIELQFPVGLKAADISTAFLALIQANEILRTGFAYHEGQFLQIVLNEIDHSQVSLVKSFDTSFKISEEADFLRPLRIQILENNDAGHRALIHLHHSIYDGWSFDMMLTDLWALLQGSQLNRETCAVLGLEDVVIGSVTSGRTVDLPEVERIIGPCIASLPLRVNLGNVPTVADLLRLIHTTNRSVIQHALLPLTDIKKLASLTGKQSLYDVLFVYQESLPSQEAKGAHIQQVSHLDMLETPILLEIEPRGGEYHAQLTYHADILDLGLADMLLSILDQLIGKLVQKPTAPLESLREDLPPHFLSIHNPQVRRYAGSQDLAELVELSAEKSPDKLAVVFARSLSSGQREEETLSYGELNNLANRIAQWIRETDPGGDNRIAAIIMEKSTLFYASLLGILKCGRPYLPILPSTPPKRIQAILEQSRASICLLDDSSQAIPGLANGNVQRADLTKFSDSTPTRLSDGSRPAYVIYTSGTTGTPKGVVLTTLNIVSHLDTLEGIYPVEDTSRLLQSCSQAFDVSDLEKAIRELDVTHLSMTPTVASLVKRKAVPNVQFLVTAGEPMTQAVFHEWKGALYQGYGPSETTNICTVKKMAEGDHIEHLGHAFENTSTFVFYPGSLLPTPFGTVGELCFGGDQVAQGYLNEPALTASKFIAHPSFGTLYRSGDLGRMLPDGSILILGRLDDQVKLRGQRIDVGEISIYFSSQRFKVLELPEEEKAYQHRLFSALEVSLPSYMVPSYLIPISVIPMTPSGKVAKAELRVAFQELALDALEGMSSIAQAAVDGVSELSNDEIRVMEAISSSLKVDRAVITRWSPLVTLGLDSITAISLAKSLSAILEKRVAISLVLQNPSVAQLTRALFTGDKQSQDREELRQAAWLPKDEIIHPVASKFQDKDLAIHSILPCTALQEAMLASPLDDIYYNNIVLRLKVSPSDMEEYWKVMCARHSILRTCFMSTDDPDHAFFEAGLPLVDIMAAWEATFRTHSMLRVGFVQLDSPDYPDISYAMVKYTHNAIPMPVSVMPPGSKLNLAKWKLDMAQEVLETLHEPPWRVSLLEQADRVSMYLTIHHALYDAHSLQIILGDLARCINGGRAHESVTIEKAVGSLLALMSRDGQKDSEAFWNSFSGEAVVNPFPTMTPLRVAQGQLQSLSTNSSLSLKEATHACRSANISLQAALQAAWTRVLSAYLGEELVIFGTVLAGRVDETMQKAAFPCITTVPVIAKNNNSNRGLLDSMMSLNKELHLHQFSRLSDIQRWLGHPGRSPFDTLLVYQRSSSSTTAPWVVRQDEGVVDYPVSIEIETPANAPIRFCITFKTDILPQEQASIILNQLDAALRHLLLQPEGKGDDLWPNAPSLASIAPALNSELPSEVTLAHQLVEAQAALRPNKVALEFVSDFIGEAAVSQTWTFIELNDIGDRVAALLSRNILPGSIVAVHFDKCPEAYFSILGILKAGCAFLALDPSAPVARREFILKDSKAAALLVRSKRDLDLQASIPVVEIQEHSLPGTTDFDAQARVTSPDATCYCLYTSGTTGEPKGCEITHENTVQALMAFQSLFRGHWDDDSRWLQFASLHFDVSVLEQYWSWSVGMTVVSAPKDLILDDLEGTIKRLRVTHIDLTPREQLKQDILDAWGPKGVIYNAYGPTEATIGVTMRQQVPSNGRPINIGRQFPNVGTYVFRQGTEILVPKGGVGELCVSGKLVGKGYLNRAQLTEERFPTLKVFKERVYRTGDLVRLLHDGSFDFLGRADDQVKLRGQRLQLGEIDHAIRSGVPHIREVATIVAKNNKTGKDLLVSFVVPQRDGTADSPTGLSVLEAEVKELRAFFSNLSAQDLAKLSSTISHNNPCDHRWRGLVCRELGVQHHDIEYVVPCTPIQQGIISRALAGAGADQSTYFNNFRLSLATETSIEKLQAAWETTIASHAILRTVFVATPDGFVQAALRNPPAPWIQLSLPSESYTIEERRLRTDWVNENSPHIVKPMQLIINQSSDTIQHNIHIFHGLYDGNSFDTILKFVFDHYYQQSPSRPCVCRFAATWPTLEARLHTGILDAASTRLQRTEAFVHGAPSLPNTPDVLIREIIRIEALDEVRKSLDVTFQSLVLALWIATLQSEAKGGVSTGIIVSGRVIESEGVENTIGPLFNTLPFFSDYANGVDWTTLIKRCHEYNATGHSLEVSVVSRADQRDREETSALVNNFLENINRLLADRKSLIFDQMNGKPRSSQINASSSSRVTSNGHSETNSALRPNLSGASEVLIKELSEASGVRAGDLFGHLTVQNLGLDSIDIVKLAAKLRFRNISLSAREIVKCATIADMVDLVENLNKTPDDTLEAASKQYQRLKANLAGSIQLGALDRERIEHVLPSTPLQEGMVSQMLQSECHQYFNHDLLEIPRQVDLQLLKESWMSVFQNSDILRTVFAEVLSPSIDLSYAQVILRSAEAPIETVELENINQVQDLIKKPGRMPSYREVWLISHALYDGWSLGLLHRNVEAVYYGKPQHNLSAEPYLQNIWSSSTSSHGFWQQYLAHAAPTMLAMRPEQQLLVSTNPHAELLHRAEAVSNCQLQQVTAFGKKHGISLQVVAQACWAAVLASMCRSLDLTFGVVLSGRDFEGAEDIMFPTMNTVALRCILHGTILEFLRYMEENMADIRDHQSYPLRKALLSAEGVNPPLFNTLFIFQKSSMDTQSGSSQAPLMRSVESSASVEYPVCVELETLNGFSSVYLWSPAITVREELGDVANAVPDEDSGSTIWTETEEKIRDVLCQFSGMPPEDALKSSTLYNLGLDSITAIKASASLREAGIPLSVRQLLVASSISHMAELAKSSQSRSPAASVSTEVSALPTATEPSILELKESQHLSLKIPSSDVECVLPALPMQVHMLSVWQNSSGALFFPTFRYRLSGMRSQAALEEAWALLVSETAILRTFFVTTQDYSTPLLQVIAKAGSAAALRRSRVAWVDALPSQTDYVLDGELVQLHVKRESEATCVLAIRIHHALYDAVTLPSIIERFSRIIGQAKSEAPSLVLWRDFINMHTYPEAKDGRRRFWRQYLGDSGTAKPQEEPKDGEAITSLAMRIQQDIHAITEAPNSTVGLWEVADWTGITIDLFVNFINGGAKLAKARGQDGFLEPLHDDSLQPTQEPAEVPFTVPQWLIGNPVTASFLAAIDVEAAVAENGLDLGIFAPSFLLSHLEAKQMIETHPAELDAKQILSRRGVDIEPFRLASAAKYIGIKDPKPDIHGPGSPPSAGTYVESASALVKSVHPNIEYRVVDDHYVGSNGIAHVRFKQTIHGIDVDNGDFNVNIGNDGSVLSYGTSFYTEKLPDINPWPSAASPRLPPRWGPQSPFSRSRPDGALRLAWRVETATADNWLLSYVDAGTVDEVHGVVDYIADAATYQVYPWGLNDPTEGNRIVIPDPWNLATSEFMWIGDGAHNYTTTRGNNGIAQDNPTGGNTVVNNHRPDSKELKFEYPYSPATQDFKQYVDASITQLFYTANKYHDLLYQLGFTEKAGNFELNNNGQGGQGNDLVVLYTQDGSGRNNANFATPPDGRPGVMRMYIFDRSTPPRDSSFEAGVVIHEFTHGLSTRLTGGPANSGCLSSADDSAQGWGHASQGLRDGSMDCQQTGGIRLFPYSTSLQTNPAQYKDVSNLKGVHDVGFVWASMLYEVLWNLIDKYGKNDGDQPRFEGGVPTDGKYLAMKLVVDAMAL